MKKSIIPLCALVLGFAICFTAFADIMPFTPKTYKVRVGDKPVNYYRQTDSVTFGMRQEGEFRSGACGSVPRLVGQKSIHRTDHHQSCAGA